MSPSFEKGFKFFLLTMMFLLRHGLKEWESVMSDGPRSHHILLNGGAIKVITLQTIKKGHESPGQLWLLPHFQSWAVFSLPPLCPGRSIWLGTRSRSCRRRSSRRRGCHQTWFARRRRLATTSHNGARHRLTFGGRKEGRREIWFIQQGEKQSYSRCVRPRSGTRWLRLRRRHMTPNAPSSARVTPLLGGLCRPDLLLLPHTPHVFPGRCYSTVLLPAPSPVFPAGKGRNIETLCCSLFFCLLQTQLSTPHTQIYHIPLFVPDSIKASCKEIIPLLQEIVALLLSIGFFFFLFHL